MNKRFISLFLAASVILILFSGCTVEVSSRSEENTSSPSTSYEPDCVIVFDGATVSIDGVGARLDDGEVLICQAGVYQVSGACENSRIMVKAGSADDVTLLLAGLTLTNPEDEAIYFKTAGTATVVLTAGSENVLTGGIEPEPAKETEGTTNADERPEEDTATGAALRSICPMTIEGEGYLTVRGYINNGIAADSGLTLSGGTLDVTAVNNGVKSDSDINICGGSVTVHAEGDGVQAGDALDITGGELNVTTGTGAEGAEMKVSDSLMMGGGGMGGGRGSKEASAEADTTTSEKTEETTESTSEEPITKGTSEKATTESAENSAEITDSGENEDDTPAAENSTASREMRGGMMPGMEMNWDADDSGNISRKGLKATNAITISGGIITADTEDDAIHSDGSITITGGELSLRSGDDGIHGETTLDISGGHTDVLYCYEGLEATAIYISDGYTNVIATDDGMNAGGMGMMGPGMRPGASQEASAEAEANTETNEATTSEEATETIETIVRITGGIVIVNSGGDGLDSNASMYIEGGTIFVSGPSSNWDSPIDFGEGSSEFVISGGSLMAAGYSGMFESPDTTDASQSSVYYIQSEYAPDNAVTVLKKADGTVLGEYAFANSYNGVLISTPDMAAGETYTLTIDGVDTTIEMTTAQYSNRGGSGEMGGPGGMGRRP